MNCIDFFFFNARHKANRAALTQKRLSVNPDKPSTAQQRKLFICVLRHVRRLSLQERCPL